MKQLVQSSFGAYPASEGEMGEERVGDRNVTRLSFRVSIDKWRSSRGSERCGIIEIIALCDEANRMPDAWQKDIITNHLHIFSEFRIQFVFVADFVPGLSIRVTPGDEYCTTGMNHIGAVAVGSG